jgi:hypothetical protein
MKGLISMLAGSLGGALGWWLGSYEGVMTAFFVSIILTGVAVYYCRRLMNEYLP